MKLRIRTVWAVALLGAAGVLFADAPSFSGFLDTRVTTSAGAGDSPQFSIGLEEYANLRMQFKIRDSAVFYSAFNLIAVSGANLQNAADLSLYNGALYPGLTGTAFMSGENYAAALELERLYFRVNSDYADFDAGLMRLAFGYSMVFGPSDFLNPKNPLAPDARLRGILGAAVSVYPNDEAKFLAFAAGPKNPLAAGGGGSLGGLSWDQHWENLSLQALYAYETPQAGSDWGIHRAGLSLKTDVEAGLVADALYTYNPEAAPGIEGLSAAAGLDYSFAEGKLYVLAEYLYSGEKSATARSVQNPGGFAEQNYLYASMRYSFNDYTNGGLACIFGFDDVSFTPVLSLEHDIFQGLTLSLSAQVPLDRDSFTGNGQRGELGPIPPGQTTGAERGTYFTFITKLRLRY
ncbi:MAG: hypothetical protein LBQ88_20475 [Treponema sp.]|jgi:hypothetical protein|nr:hypothetical protein [Treponema sp.]